MNFTFKDNASEDLFKNNRVDTIEDKSNFTEGEIDDLYQEFTTIEEEVKHSKEPKEEKIIEVEKIDAESFSNQDFIMMKSIMSRIESKQNVMLEVLENMSLPTVNQVKIKPIKEDELDLLNFNLSSFNTKLITLSVTSKHIQIKELLILLSQVSNYILSNSFYIFTLEKSPIKKALITIDGLGMDKKINKSALETEKLLNQIDKISSMGIFEQNYYYSNLLLEKGLLLQSIILLNEAISIYMIEAIKSFSKPIEKHTYLIGEENRPKLYSQAKDFFISLFPINGKDDKNEKIIPLFPNHKFVKDIDNEIAYKFNNLYATWKHKGDVGLFEKYSYIIDRVRRVRNNLAHGNMEIDFYNLKKEMLEVIKDFEYLSIEKNIFKYKTRR
jgi:hypothetical protein